MTIATLYKTIATIAKARKWALRTTLYHYLTDLSNDIK